MVLGEPYERVIGPYPHPYLHLHPYLTPTKDILTHRLRTTGLK